MYLYDDLASLTAAFVMMSQETRVTSAMAAGSATEAKVAKSSSGSHSLVGVFALELRGARKGALEILGFLKLTEKTQ
jgi:hypothetical protein